MTELEYEKTKLRVAEGEIAIKNAGGFLNAPPHWVKGYQILAERLLMYEIDNDLLPI